MNEKKSRTTITTTEAAARLGITPRHVRHLIKIGQLPAVKAGRDWLIEEKNLKQAEARRKPGRPRKKGRIMRNEYVIIDEGGQYVGTWTYATAPNTFIRQLIGAAKAAGGTAAMPDGEGCVTRATLAKA